MPTIPSCLSGKVREKINRNRELEELRASKSLKADTRIEQK